MASSNQAPSLSEAIRLWLKIGLLSFGGPAAQIALMHRMLVEEKRWLDENTYLNALSFCMLLPGPEAMQLATYAGWRMHGWRGGLAAGLLFVIPGALVILALAVFYALFGNVSLVAALFVGIKATVLIIVLEALIRVAGKALKGLIFWVIAGIAFVGIFFFSVPFPLIIIGAAIVGFLHGSHESASRPVTSRGSWSGFFSTVALWLSLWALPFVVVLAINPESVLIEIGTFFSRLAVVTFGGAYAVLAYMGQAVVEQFGWLDAGEMMDGLGLAETTPGPLILVTEFVGFLAAFREGGMALGLAGAVMTLWVTFVPCFLWIFAGAPHIEWISSQPRLKNALTAISAAVVGVIVNLSLWFALHVMFRTVHHEQQGWLTLWKPDLASIDLVVVMLSGICGVLLLMLKWSVFRVLLIAAVLGMTFGVLS